MMKKMKSDRVTLRYSKIGNINDLKISVFTYASFAGSYLIFLSTGFKLNRETPCCPLSWQSIKIKRKVTSTREAETLAVREGLEEALVILSKMTGILNKKKEQIKIEAFVDNDDTYKAIYSTKQTVKGRMMIDMGVIKDLVESKEVEQISWISKDYQLADSLTKQGASTKDLLWTLNEGRIPKFK